MCDLNLLLAAAKVFYPKASVSCAGTNVLYRWKTDKDDKTEVVMENNKRNWDIELCSTKTLKPYQESLVPFFVIFKHMVFIG